MYNRKIDLMDETVFPRESIYLAKENPNSNSSRIPRNEKSDEEITMAVTADMSNTLGEDLEP
ncbi:MAG: hypothetical protein LBI04_02040 [Treponema sp.]|jgi:hypothetical protein|nr:hypothetical protein [Treponema sp.]